MITKNALCARASVLVAVTALVACSSSAPDAVADSGPRDASSDVDAGGDATGQGSPASNDAGPKADGARDGCTCDSRVIPLSATSAACVFTWASGTTLPDVSLINVEIASDADAGFVIVAKDAANGWSLDDVNAPTKVTLNGSSCTQFEATTAPRIQLDIGCISILPAGCE